jgi:hypothetical protein
MFYQLYHSFDRPRIRYPEDAIGEFAPHDFEIRVTDEGSFGYHPFGADGSSGNAHWVPFEVWDIGDVGPFGINGAGDDVQLIPGIFSDEGGFCRFAFDEGPHSPVGGLDWFNDPTDRIFAFYPAPGATYDDWKGAIAPLVDADPDACPSSPETDAAASLVDTLRGPLQNLIFMMDPASPDYRDEMIPVGNVVRFLTTRPTPPQPSVPANGSLIEPPFTLYWQTPPNVDSVRVQILRIGETVRVVRDVRAADSRFAIGRLDPGLYEWRLSNGGDHWSDNWTFVVVPSTANQDDRLGLPTALELKAPYPNPSNGPRSLVIGVPSRQRVSLAVYDLLGRRVEAITDREHSAGWHTETWHPKSLSAGVYFIKLESKGGFQTQPVVVTR